MGICKIILIGILVGGVSIPAFAVSAIPNSLDWRKIRHIRDENPWLKSGNIAGLLATDAPKLFEVQMYVDKRNGDWVDYYQSPNSFRLGASAESFYPFSSSVVLYGKVNYSRFVGKDMGGSYFIDPIQTPFDMVEYTNGNRGTKKLENYNLKGGVSVELSSRFCVGAEVSYLSGNYAKQKDLRHVNDLLDMKVAVGLLYRLFPNLDVGTNYIYSRRLEGIFFDTYSQSDEIFHTLINYGAFLGSQEAFGENGYTKENDEKPLIDKYHGGAFQLDWRLSEKLSFFSEFGYQWRRGQYGTKSPSSVVYSEHKSGILSCKGIFLVKQGKDRHFLQLSCNREKLYNSENIYQYENEAGGKTDVAYYGSLDVAEHTKCRTTVGYIGYWGEKYRIPLWITHMALDFYRRNQIASRHPYYRLQRLHTSSFRFCCERNFIKKKDCYTVLLGGGYIGGGGDRNVDGTYATPSADQPSPKTMDLFLQHEFEYLTAKQIKGKIAFEYSKLLGNGGLKVFGKVGYGITHALKVEYITGSYHHKIFLALGCVF